MQRFKGIKIPSSAKDLELYSTMKGNGVAAKEIVALLKATIVKAEKLGVGNGTIASNAKKLGKAVDATGLYKKMCELSNFGATDSEPRYHVGQALVSFAKSKLGISQNDYRPELADWLPMN